MFKRVYDLKTLMNSEGQLLHREMKHVKWTYLFGLISINYFVEDRRSDLTFEVHPTRYKHYIDIKVFGNRYNWTFRTPYAYEQLPFYQERGR
jgi:hypothetical protein